MLLLRIGMRAAPLALLAACALFVCACGVSSDPAPRAKSVLLVTLDTTRRDALGVYRDLASNGAPRAAISPNLDALARQSVIFTRCSTTAPLTLPAHASMLTGLYPVRHTVHINSMQAVPQSAATLAEDLQRAGFDTAAFVGAVVLDRAFGLAQGFQTYTSPVAPKVQEALSYGERPASEVTHDALEWFKGRDRTRPFFAWLHYYDPHLPYEPPPQFREQAGKNSYLGEVAYVDHELQRVFALLEEQGLWDELLVIVTADHGDSLGQHNEDTHGPLAYETTIAVPLLVRWPDGRLAGTQDATITSVVDVYPTVLEALDLPLRGSIDGISLWEPARAGRDGVYMEALYGYHAFRWSQLLGWRDEQGKYLHSARPEYYDVDADFDEVNDLLAQRPAEAERARKRLQELFRLERLAVGEADKVDGSMLAKVAMLGYVGTGSMGNLVTGTDANPLETGDRPAPADCMPRYVKATLAQSYLYANNGAMALPLLEAVLAGEPRNPNALFMYSSALIQTRLHQRALAAVESALKWGEPWYGLHRNRGMCLEQLGRVDEAIVEYKRALELEPDLTVVWLRLSEIARKAGDEAEAKRCYDRAVELGLPTEGVDAPLR
jgi:arylsulfatase A-like enzyme